MESKSKQTMTPELLANLREQIKTNPQSATEVIDRLKAPDAAELINELPLEDAVLTISFMPLEEAVAVMNEPSCDRRPRLIQEMDVPRAAAIISEMYSDERVDIIRKIDSEYREKLIPLLPKSITEEIKLLIQYPPTTAGGIMSTEFVRLSPESSLGEALNHIRATSKKRAHIYSAYVLDDDNRLIGAISLRDMVIANPAKSVQDVMRKYPISVHCLEDQEKVVQKLSKYNLLAVPVVDDHNCVLGFVTVDDALDVLTEEQTEDIQKLGGMEALDEPYLTVEITNMIKKRVGWLVVLFIGEMLTATAMGYFEGEIEKAVVLALFVPLIISSGGNSGSQAATLIIRAISLGEVNFEDWWTIMRREIISGLAMGVILGMIGFMRIAIWTLFSKIYGPHWFLVGITVGISLIGVVLWGTISGSMLPLLLKRLGLDPATSSAPFVATLVDVTGIIIYFTVASAFLRGTLLN